MNFYNLFNRTSDIHILLNIYYLLEFLNNVIEDEKCDIIIGIGDSPSIFLQILKLFKKSYIIKYLPISGLTNMNKKNNILKIKMKKFPDVGKILWVDFACTGNTFDTFYKNIPSKIKKKSKFFLYGSDYNLYKKYLKNKNIFFYLIVNMSIFDTFLSHIVGNSEKYNIRCVEYKKVNKNYKTELVNNTKFNKKNCKNFAKWLHKEMTKANFVIF
jgi:hypothetical protein